MAGDAGSIRAGRAFVELYSTDKNLVAGLTAAEKSVVALGKRVNQVGSGMVSFGKTLMGLGIGAAAGMALASKAFVSFDEALASIKANSNATTDTMKMVEKSILDVSKSTGQSATSIAKVYDELLKAGVEVDKVLGGTGAAVTKFSKVAKVEGEVAATVITDAMNVFGVSATKAMDTLTKAADSSSVSLEQVIDSFSQFAVVGEQAGLSIQEVATAVALLGASGIKGSDAGTSLKTMMQRLAAPADEGAKAMKQFGIDVRDSSRNMLPLTDIVTELKNKLDKLNPEQKSKAMRDIFGSDAIRAGAVLMKKGAAGLDEFSKTMAKSLTVAQKYKIIMGSLQGGIDRLWAAIERAGIALGSVFGPALSSVLSIMGGFLEGVTTLITKNKKWVLWFAKTVAVTIALGSALVGLGAAMKFVSFVAAGAFSSMVSLFTGFRLLLSAVSLVISVFSALVPAFLALSGPMMVLVVALVAVVAYLAIFTNAFQTAFAAIKAIFGRLVSEAMTTFNAITVTVKQAVAGIAAAIMKGNLSLAWKILVQEAKIIWMELGLFLAKLWADWGIELIDVFSNAQFAIAGLFIDLWFGIEKGLYNALDVMAAAFSGSWDGIKTGFFDALNVIKDGIIEVAKFLLDQFLGVGSFLAGMIARLMGVSSKDAAKELQKINDELRQKVGYSKPGTPDSGQQPQGQPAAPTLDELEAQRKGVHQGLADERAGRQAARQAASDAGLKGRMDALAAAKEELGKLTAEAMKKPKVPLTPPPEGAFGKPGGGAKPVTPEEIGAGLEGAARKTEARGTFSAIGAARGLGAGVSVAGLLEEQNKEAKKQTDELKKLNKKAEGKIVFK